VTGRVQRAHSVTHVLAEEIEDISAMLDLLVRPAAQDGTALPHEMPGLSRTDTWEPKHGQR
jgi:DNA-directed RNA polymerase